MADRETLNPDVTTKIPSTNKNQTLDGDVTARSKGLELEEPGPEDVGEMNIPDAKASGYTDEEGKAVSKSKENVKGSPTGAYTDIGAGRSSVVRKH